MVDSSDLMSVDAKVGNPWSILPIKNKKYAKDLVEVHLSDRSLTSLEKFQEFPNLEVIWLNTNQVSESNKNISMSNELLILLCCSYKT